MSESLTELQRRAESLHGRYVFRFANKPRATRHLGAMDELIRDTEALSESARVAGDPAGLLGTLAERLSLYRRERQAIVEAQRIGEEAIQAAHLATEANRIFRRYRRHFAGRDRSTRDLLLLDALRSNLSDVYVRMSTVAAKKTIDALVRDMQVVEQNLALYERERGEIVAAQSSGEAELRASRLATRANEQFTVYRIHFAGHPRLSRSIALAERLVNNVDTVHGEMVALQLEGHDTDTHRRNVEVVIQRLDGFRSELDEIRRAKESTTPAELTQSLGDAVNRVLEEYDRDFAGQNRSTRNIERLDEMIEQLLELHGQMANLARAYGDKMNEHNLAVADDGLSLLEAEYQRVKEAQTH